MLKYETASTLNLTKMKELKPSGLFCVPVPEHTINIRIYNEDDKPYIRWIDDIINIVDLPKGKWELIGSITAEHIDFDVEPYVYQSKDRRSLGIPFWKGHEKDEWQIFSKDAFRSLLTANDVHFVNPYGASEPELIPECCNMAEQDRYGFPQCCCQPIPTHESVHIRELWQQAESKLVEKILILKPL